MLEGPSSRLFDKTSPHMPQMAIFDSSILAAGRLDQREETKKKRSLAFGHAFGSSGLSQEVRIAGSAKRTVPNEGYPFPACDVSVPLCGANPTCGLIGHGPALAFRLSGNAVAVRTEPLGLKLPTGTLEPMLLSWDSPG